jgi:membrane-associated phospholipid phosphatase
VARLHERLDLPAPLTTACLFAAPAGVARSRERSRRRDAAVWAAQMWAYKNAFELPADHPRRQRRRMHVDYPILADRWLGRGMAPGRRLQRRLRHRGRLSALDKALTFFYWTWEAEPHLALAWIRWRRPESFPAAAGRLAAVFDLTLVAYWVLPTAPPWWASEEEGRMGGDIRRVMDAVARWLKGKENPTGGDHTVGANPFAAMPSDHFASAAMTAILLAEQDPRLGAFGLSYALLLAFTLVYLGEHYVVDLLAGAVLALTVNRLGAGCERAAAELLDWSATARR